MSEEFEAEETMSDKTSDDAATPSPSTAGSETSRPVVEERKTMAGSIQDALAGPSLASIIDVPLRITVEVGTTRMLVREVLQLNKGSVVPLDRITGDPADILVNGRLIARGEVTSLDDSLAVRIVELVSREQNRGER